MKNRKRKYLALLLASAISLSVTACGGDKEESEKPTVARSEADFIGYWVYDEYGDRLRISEDGTWQAFGEGGTASDVCTYKLLTDGSLQLYKPDGSEDVILTLSSDGKTMTDSENDTISRAELPEAAPLENYVGFWKNNTDGSFLQFSEDIRWAGYSADGIVQKISKFFHDTQGVHMLDANGTETGLYLLNTDDTLTDLTSGATYRRDPFENRQPSAMDPLTQSVAFPSNSAVVMNYPASLSMAAIEPGDTNLVFSSANPKTPADSHANIMAMLMPVKGYDQYMTKGYNVAQEVMTLMLQNTVTNNLAGMHATLINSRFEDGTNYYGIKGIVQLDNIWDPSQPQVMGTLFIRYMGPTGFAPVVLSMSEESHLTSYGALALSMMNSITAHSAWSTAPKPVPQKPAGQKPAAPSHSGSGNKPAPQKTDPSTPSYLYSDPGDTGDVEPYYWTDADGDVWYCDGYNDIFIGGGDSYYVDDGDVYESNDAGWDDGYDPYSDPGDTYDDYYDDYDPYSDPGDTYDDYYDDYDDYDDYGEYDSYDDYDDYGEYDDYDYYDDY